ncbi:MAG: hypothetical protein AAFQ94_11340 [Bacteroidota bacterium]
MKSTIEILAILLLIAYGCQQKKNENTSTKSDTLVIEQSQSIKPIEQPDTALTSEAKIDGFTSKIEEFVIKYPAYKPVYVSLIDTIDQKDQHWFIEIIEKNRKIYERNPDNPIYKKKLRKLPLISDYESIEHIRKADFKTGNGLKDLAIENWTFKTEADAFKWYGYLKDSLRTALFTKPPRFQWLYGRDITLFTIRSAAHWFDFKDSVTMHMTERKISQLYKIYQPLNLKHFKKWSGPSHGGPSHGGPSHGDPPLSGQQSVAVVDSTQINNGRKLFDYGGHGYYEYFFFMGQRYKGAERAGKQNEYPSPAEFKIITSLHKPFTGDEQFHEMEESLVAINCSIEDDDLGGINFINRPQDQLESMFGPLIRQNGAYQTYGYADRLFTFKIENDTIRSFQYRWLQDK